VSGGNRQVDATFNTAGALPGLYDVEAVVSPGLVLTLPAAVKVVAGRAGGVSVDLTGPARVRINSPGRYYATVTNDSNVDAFDVPIVFAAPTGSDMRVIDNSKVLLATVIDSMTSQDPGPSQLSPSQAAEVKAFIQNYQEQPVEAPGGGTQYLMATVSRIPPGTSATAVFELTPRTRVDGSVAASVPVDTAYFEATNHVSDFQRRGYLPLAGRTEKINGVEVDCSGLYADFCATSKLYMTGLDQAQRTAQKYGCVSFAPLTLGLYGNDCQFNNPLAIPSPFRIFKEISTRKFPQLKPVFSFYEIFGFAKGIYDDFFGAAEQIEREKDGVSFGVTSTDPNDKLSPQGAGADHFIKGSRPVDYTVRFENVASASAPAQRVTVVDQLPTALDWSTVHLTGVTVSGVDVPLAEGPATAVLRTSHGVASLDEHRSVLVDSSVDVKTGRLVVHLQGPPGLDDPFSPTPYQDFLPPNTVAPVGGGEIRYTAQPVHGVTTGASVRNRASITFDDHVGGPTIETPETLNTIDADAPAVVLSSLAPVSGESAGLTWTASDIGAGVQHVQILQSTDDGPFASIAVSVSNSVMVPLQTSHKYAFRAVAVDAVGNISEPSNIATTMSGPSRKRATVAVAAASPNPSRLGDVVTFTADISASSGTPDGEVTFREGQAVLAKVPLVNGKASFSTTSMTVGDHVVDAFYSGTSSYESSTALVTQSVGVAPKIIRFTPTSARVGALVAIQGRHFTDANVVRFNGVTAVVVAASDSVISARVPFGGTTGRITVETKFGTAISKNKFAVKPLKKPSISGISPNSGRVGETVTIKGSSLGAVRWVTFGGVIGDILSATDTALVARVPAGATTGYVQVRNLVGSGKSMSKFRVLRSTRSVGHPDSPTR
jgi:hypothetical protein